MKGIITIVLLGISFNALAGGKLVSETRSKGAWGQSIIICTYQTSEGYIYQKQVTAYCPTYD